MKLKLIALMFTAILVTGCGHENLAECRMKEMQKCQTERCALHAEVDYCHFGYDYKK